MEAFDLLYYVSTTWFTYIYKSVQGFVAIAQECAWPSYITLVNTSTQKILNIEYLTTKQTFGG